MTQISVCVQGCNVEVKLKGRLTSGMVGVPVSFSFDDAWENLHILAVFRCLDKSFVVPLMDAMEITVPWEVMCAPGVLEIGAEGRSIDGSVVMPTVWATVDRIYPGANGTDESALTATPKLYDRLMMLVENPPKRGVDYWTPDDIAQIQSYIDTATVNKLCPAFAVSGSAVTCEPVEGYPLDIISTINAKEDGTAWSEIKLYHCGKNIINQPESLSFTKNVTVYQNILIPKGDYVISCGNLTTEGYRIPAIGFYNINTSCFINLTLPTNGEKKITLTEDAYRYTILSNGWDYSGSTGINATIEKLMLRPASVANAEYEPYKGHTLVADISEAGISSGSYNWSTGTLSDADGNEITLTSQEIPAMPGMNTLYSDTGDTGVTGRADPTAVIEKLTNAIIALGGNV